MSDALLRQRERTCAAEGCVLGAAPDRVEGPLPLVLPAPRCERCGKAQGPEWSLEPWGAWAGYVALRPGPGAPPMVQFAGEAEAVIYRTSPVRVLAAVGAAEIHGKAQQDGLGWVLVNPCPPDELA